mgnify:CR=1 FL=1
MSTGAKRAADLHSYIERTANHSTKPRKVGDNSEFAERSYDISHALVGEEDRARTMLASVKIIDKAKSDIAVIEEQILAIREECAVTLPRERFLSLERQRRKLSRQKAALQNVIQAAKLKRKSDILYTESRFERIFCDLAKSLLPPDVYDQLHKAAMRLQWEGQR